ncbi:hypothetical protein GGI21_005772, partial [Coemansia aciculifera]
MHGVLADRECNITRHILLRGDLAVTKDYVLDSRNPCVVYPRKSVRWPAIDIHRYIDHIQLNRHFPMGIDPMRGCKDLYTSIDLEEPGGEWEQKQIDSLYGVGISKCDNGGSSLEQDGYVCGFTASADGSEISDTRRNGGMGIVLKRQEGGVDNDDEDDVQFLTHLQVKYPELTESRTRQVHFYDVFEGRCSEALSKHYQPVVDMTRTQVLGQVLRASSAQSTDLHPLPQLSKFVSCSVAEEAVSGVSRIWDELSDVWKQPLSLVFDGIMQSTPRKYLPYPGSYKTGWISVLEAAIVADIPPQVIARCYHRL